MKQYFHSSFWVFACLGLVLSVFFLFPIHDFLNFHELKRGLGEQILSHESARDYVLSNIKKTLTGQRLAGTVFFGLIGILLGLSFYVIFRTLQRRNAVIDNLKREIERDISFVLKKGESAHLEFKSSFRWDYNKQQVNKALELAILKTIAAFMNSEGGSLIIGVDDSAATLGLDNDYQTLRVKNQDGFEVAIMTAVSSKIGANHCAAMTVLFHEVENNEICQILVSKASKPVFVNTGNNMKFYLRTGAGTRELNIQEATEYISSHW